MSNKVISFEEDVIRCVDGLDKKVQGKNNDKVESEFGGLREVNGGNYVNNIDNELSVDSQIQKSDIYGNFVIGTEVSDVDDDNDDDFEANGAVFVDVKGKVDAYRICLCDVMVNDDVVREKVSEVGSWTPPKSYVGKPLSDIPTPAFLVDKEKVVKNCQNMLQKCAELNIKLRPHVKTHKTVEAALLQTGGQKKCITVSTFREAEFFADHGWDDILVALPLAPFHLSRVRTLSNRVSNFHFLVDNVESTTALSQLHTLPGKTAWSVFIKVDAGYARAGVRWSDTELAVRICEALHPKVILKGLYAHCGNSYNTTSPTEILAIRHRTAERVLKLSKELIRRGFTCPAVSIGSTPSMSISISAEARRIFMKLSEVHPGNYVFYDLQQACLGSCSLDDVACRIMTRVIGHYPHRKQMLIDCGFTALTKQGLNANKIVSGYAVFEYHPHLKLIEMTQEVGKVEAVDDDLDINRYPIGTILFLYPYHACAAAFLHPVYYIHKDDVVQEEWRPVRGW